MSNGFVSKSDLGQLIKEMDEPEMEFIDKAKRINAFKANQTTLFKKMIRKWCNNDARRHLLDFPDKELNSLKKCFGQLDGDGGGNISVEELEGPLVGLGFAQSRDQVEQLIGKVEEHVEKMQGKSAANADEDDDEEGSL